MKNKKILILGGTGALGKSLIKRYYDNNDIIVFSRDEHKHVDLLKKYDKLESYLGDIRDKSSVENALVRYKPDVVINTAALKHVPICENNPIESVKTNIIGHQNVIECVGSHDIETLIFVSTDKACKPINVYGMCKAISEQLYISFAKQQQTTKVVMVRYGNVLESTGSVIPYFKSLLDNGSDFLPITHSDMTRFLLTLDEAVDLIDWSYHHKNSHGKIAVPKVKSMRVVDVAKSLIKSYGKNTTVEESTNFVKLKNIGIRSGEKLHEEMISTEEWLRTEDLENYLITSEIVNEEMWSYSSKNSVLTEKETYKFLSKSGVIN
jgi:UDP-N-acetylglucosamine 4,6-dehydratase/5-epimerase|tara:strand:- start:3143 stop:4108 length:966 start_codon:yes stop_codon:yes gene_type:complete